MYCTDCGYQMQSTDLYCAQCGHKAGAQPRQSDRPRPQSRLMRSMGDKKIAGVCSGVARQYGWDVTLVRLAFLLGIVFHGVGLLVYLLAWITMPRDDMAPVQANYGV